MIKLATAAAVAALLGVSASASAFWGGGPWGGSPWGGGNDWCNDMMGDGSGDFNKNKSRGGRGFGRGYHRYRDYSGYGPYGAPRGGGYGAPYYGGGYPYAASYAAPAAPAVPAETK